MCAVVVQHPGWALTLDDVRVFLTKAAIARQKFPEQLELVLASTNHAIRIADLALMESWQCRDKFKLLWEFSVAGHCSCLW